ncbi:MAG: cytochrome c biogenesis protein CcdA [Gemmatimonadota bacterium]
MEVQISFPLAFAAGLVSFLSPCILPLVPSYLAFVSGLSLEELTAAQGVGDATQPSVRGRALLHSTLFMLGFGAVFMTLGLVATSAGSLVAGALPWIHRAGGAVMIGFGLLLLGLLRVPGLARDLRPRLSTRPAGALGSLAVGVAFGAGWTPCIGPVLGTVLLYAGLETTRVHGTLLLGTYALGLGVPFVAAAAGLGTFLAASARLRRWLVPAQRVAGTVLVVIGFTMVTGHFARVSAFLAGLGQLINLDIS